jgi:hypothetical protein
MHSNETKTLRERKYSNLKNKKDLEIVKNHKREAKWALSSQFP